jgi:hypothetical protein
LGSWFSENISELISRGDEVVVKGAQGNFIANKIEIYLDMFGASMKHRISQKICGPRLSHHRIGRQD